MPVSFDWPSVNGALLTFVAQLNLSELQSTIDPLPKGGILYFFTGDPEGSGGDNAVLYAEIADLTLKCRRPSKREKFQHEVTHFKAIGLTFEETACLPPIDPMHHTMESDEFDAMLEIHDELHRSDSRLLGYPGSSIDELTEYLSRPPDEWKFLFQIDSIEPCNDMCWWDNGKLAYFLPCGSLRKFEFGESLACVVESG